jgi:hypothetical protein
MLCKSVRVVLVAFISIEWARRTGCCVDGAEVRVTLDIPGRESKGATHKGDTGLLATTKPATLHYTL